MLKFFLDLLDIKVNLVKASDYEFCGHKSDLILDICVKLGADKYIFGEQGKTYANVESFSASGITAYFQTYNHPTYSQINGPFLPYMSIIDLLFNTGPESTSIIMQGNATSVKELEAS